MTKQEEGLERKRLLMVEEQIQLRGIRDDRVLAAFRSVPRHLFVPREFWDEAYEDHPLPIGQGQTISQPYMVALMTESLELKSSDRVLEIGTGSGYQAAILSGLAREVYSIERVPELAAAALARLTSLGYKNVHVKSGDGTLGWPEAAPFDAIVVTAGAPFVPDPLVRQLADDGRLAIPVGTTFGQMLQLVRKEAGRTKRHDVCYCVFVPLVGAHGWRE